MDAEPNYQITKAARLGGFPECQSTPKPAKTEGRIGGISLLIDIASNKHFQSRQNAKKPCTARVFALLRKSGPNVPPVRRRVRFACLWRFFALCQTVKKTF
jgi:hypothetical protein